MGIGLSSGSRLRTDKIIWRTVLQPQEVTVVDSEEDSEIVVGEDVAVAAAVVVGEEEVEEERKKRTGFLSLSSAVW